MQSTEYGHVQGKKVPHIIGAMLIRSSSIRVAIGNTTDTNTFYI